MPESEKENSSRLYCRKCKSIYRSGFEHCPNDESLLEPLVDDPMLGVTLGTHYVIDKCVGEGAMGRVYLAHHSRLTRRRFAIKILLGELAADPTMRMRFSQEAEAASRLQHPNVVPVLDYGKTDEGLLYLVMDFIDGEPLSERIERGRLSEAEAIDFSKQVCLGLTHAHDQGLVHRDFKPENVVLVTNDGRVTPRILDFGLAIINSNEESSIRLTTAGMVVGTPAYVSPEQARAMAVDRRTDLFALGVAMYEMICGILPFDGGVIEILYANATQDPPAFRERNPAVRVSAELEALVSKLMARELDDRYQTANEVYKALEGLEHSALRRSTQQVVADQIAQRDFGVANTLIHTSEDSQNSIAASEIQSASGIPLISNPEMQESTGQEKQRKRGAAWMAVALVCLLAGGAFAYVKISGAKSNSETKVAQVKSRADVVPPSPAEVEAKEVKDDGPVDTKDVGAVIPAPERPEVVEEPVVLPTEEVANNSETKIEVSNTLDAQRNKGIKSGTTKRDRGNKRTPQKTQPEAITAKVTPEKTIPKVVENPVVQPKVVIPPVTPPTIKPKPPIPPPLAKPKNYDAIPTISGLQVKGPMSSREIKRAVERRMSSLRDCYKSASKRSNKVPTLSVKVSFAIDEAKRATQVAVKGATLSGLGSCIGASIKKVQSRNAPDTGLAKVSFSIRYVPQ